MKGALALLLCLMVGACSMDEPPVLPALSTTPTAGGPLPGQQIWKQGVSSFLFGTNDTQEWASDNVETDPAVQQALKDAHFTLMRTFFFDKSLADGHATTDTEIQQRIQTVEKTGMACLGVLVNIMNAAFAEHVVRYLGSRCNLYEFGNEPDYNDFSLKDYMKQWNTVVPLLRKINPQAKFIGPAMDSCDDTISLTDTSCFLIGFLQGVKTSGVLPDAVSFHRYPCYRGEDEARCLSSASSFGQEARKVKSWVQSILGKNLPVGISEWNYDPGIPPSDYGDAFMQQFTTDALQSMIQAKVDFATQFDALSFSGYGGQDMFDLNQHAQPKAQYYAIKQIISEYRP
jgi:hypothetical protein